VTKATFSTHWDELGRPLQRCLELAHLTLVGGGLACGSVVTDPDGTIVAEGRNRAYDPPGGTEKLQGSPVAHAEINALAEIATGFDLSGCTLWSSQQPCSMCLAACRFTEVGRVQFLGVDPAFVGTAKSQEGAALDQAADVAPEWPLVANVLFLHNIVARRGRDAEPVRRNRELEPETVGLAVELLDEGVLRVAPSLVDALAASWDRFADAAAQRSARRGRDDA
jgi:tRNA(Arg) A34 adenosine deaminase TadA